MQPTATYDLSGVTTSMWTDIRATTSWWDVREPLPVVPPSPPKLRRTDGGRDVCMPLPGGPLTEEELDAKITLLRRRTQRLHDGVERLRRQMRTELKMD